MRKMNHKGFIILPEMWWRILSQMRVGDSTWRVALLILDLLSKSPYGRIRLTNVAARGVGVSRTSKVRAIGRLRRAGLIIVTDRPRKSPIIKPMFVD